MSKIDKIKDDFMESWDQLIVLTWKNYLISIRSWKTTLLQCLAPVIFVLLLLVLQYLPHNAFYEDLDPPKLEITGIRKCIPYDEDYCYSLVYAPNNLTMIEPIIQTIAKESNMELADYDPNNEKANDGKIVGFGSQAEIIDWLWTHQNVSQGILVFYPNVTVPNIQTPSYTLMYNASCLNLQTSSLTTECPDIRYEIQRTVDQAFLRNYTGKGTINLKTQPYPIISMNSALNDTVSTYGILFFYCGLMFNFVIIIYMLVVEKEKKLKQGMKLMGMKSSMFWLSWFNYSFVMTLIATILLIISGYICWFTFFLKTNVAVLFISFFGFGAAMITLGFFVSTLINTSKQAITVAMFLFVIGVLIQSFLSSPDLISFIYADETWSKILRYTLLFYPPFNFAKIISDITAQSFDYGLYKGPGYSWDDLFLQNVNAQNVIPPPTIQSWYLLLFNFFFYLVLTWYFENLLPSTTKPWSKPWFFFTKEYWGEQRIVTGSISSGPLIRSQEDPSDIDEDVVAEDHVSLNESSGAVCIQRLSKTFKKHLFCKSKGDIIAVDNVSINIEAGSLFCFLGHNGAGKTTTINMLTGLFPPTRGEAFIFGHSVLTEMDKIRHSMGVCPQHDILWDELTAKEHLEIFVRLKKIDKHLREEVINEKLQSVRLLEVGKHRVSSFSGGMKRRLSVAVSTIGDPNIIFMDEPTTGMDPLSRRHVWELIEELKKDRVIILTTHSMEEADVLSDKIAIMAHGKLRCIGNSLHLKNKFGDGYRVVIVAHEHQNEQAKNLVSNYLSSADLIAESGTSLVFGVPPEDTSDIIPFFRYLESDDPQQVSINDWAISQTTLEDVFLKITRAVYSGGRNLTLENDEIDN